MINYLLICDIYHIYGFPFLISMQKTKDGRSCAAEAGDEEVRDREQRGQGQGQVRCRDRSRRGRRPRNEPWPLRPPPPLRSRARSRRHCFRWKTIFGDSQLELVKVYFLTSFIPRRDLFTGHLFSLTACYKIIVADLGLRGEQIPIHIQPTIQPEDAAAIERQDQHLQL